MPVILLQIDATNSASGAINQLTGNLSALDQVLARTTQTATGTNSAFARMEQALVSNQRMIAGTAAEWDKYNALLGRVTTGTQAATDMMGRHGNAVGLLGGQYSTLGRSMGSQVAYFDAVAAASDRATAAFTRQMAAQRGLAMSSPVGFGGGSGSAANTLVRDASPAFRNGVSGALGGNIGSDIGGGFGGGFGGLAGRTLLGGGTGPMIAAAVAGYLGYKAIQAGNAYTGALAQVQAGTGASNTDIANTGQSALNQGASGTSPFDATTLVKGDYYMYSSGVRPNVTSGARPVITAASRIAKFSDNTVVSNAVTDLQDAFGGGGKGATVQSLTAYTDMLTKAEQFGKTQQGDISKVISKFAIPAELSSVTAAEALAAISKQTGTGTSARQATLNTASLIYSEALHPVKTTKDLAKIYGLETGANAYSDAGGFFNYQEQVRDRIKDPNQLAAFLHQRNAITGFGTIGLKQGNQGGFEFTQGLEQGITGSGGVTGRQNDLLSKAPSQQWKNVTAEFNTDLATAGKTLSATVTPALISMASASLKAAEGMGQGLAWISKNLPRVTNPVGSFGNTLDNTPVIGGIKGAATNPLNMVLPGLGTGFSFTQDAISAVRNLTSGSRPRSNTDPVAPAYMARPGSAGGFLDTFGNTADAASRLPVAQTTAMSPGGRGVVSPGGNAYTAIPSYAGIALQQQQATLDPDQLAAMRAKGAAYMAGTSGRADAVSALDEIKTAHEVAMIKGASLAQQTAFLNQEIAFERFHAGDLHLTKGQIDLQQAQGQYALGQQFGTNYTKQQASKRADLVDQQQYDVLKGINPSKINAAILAFDKSAGTMSAWDLKLEAAQFAKSQGTLNPVVNTKPFFETNPGLGGLMAGPGSTAIRMGGAIDPATQENRELRRELTSANNRIAGLLQQIANLLGQRSGQSATPPSSVAGGDGYHS